MTIRKTFAWLAAMLVACAASAPAAWAADDAATIRAGTAAWVKAFNAGNTDGVLAQYTQDAVVMPPGSPLLRGHAAIKAYLAKEIAGAQAGGVKFAFGDVNDVGVKGDTAWHAGTYAITDKGGATLDTGGYMEVWRKSGGKWHIIRDIWNSSTPPPAPAPAPAAAPKK